MFISFDTAILCYFGSDFTERVNLICRSIFVSSSWKSILLIFLKYQEIGKQIQASVYQG